MHSDNLGIESECSAGIPTLRPNTVKPEDFTPVQ